MPLPSKTGDVRHRAKRLFETFIVAVPHASVLLAEGIERPAAAGEQAARDDEVVVAGDLRELPLVSMKTVAV